jgi:hypothetical protein
MFIYPGTTPTPRFQVLKDKNCGGAFCSVFNLSLIKSFGGINRHDLDLFSRVYIQFFKVVSTSVFALDLRLFRL